MTKSCKISVVIPCFNHGEFLPEAVASVTRIGRDDIELIIVDDGSTDERTQRELDNLAAKGITVIRQENKGLAAARNAGVLASRGECIFPLDADDHMRSGWIERGIRIFESDSQVGVVYGDAECFGARTGRWFVGPFLANRLLPWNFIHASALYRRSVWEQNRGYDGNMPVQGLEDWDFWLGALEHGWRFAYMAEVFFEYRIAEGSMLTRTRGFEKEIGEYMAVKHAHLYRSICLQLASQQDSLKWAFGNIGRLLIKWLQTRARAARDIMRARIWFPILRGTRPVRHALGLRQQNATPPSKK